MTAREMVPAIGACVLITSGVGEILIAAKVVDVKTAWSTVRLLVEPVSGSGSAWVELSRLRRQSIHSAGMGVVAVGGAR